MSYCGENSSAVSDRRCQPVMWRRTERFRIDRHRQSTLSSLVDIDHHASQQLAAIATSRYRLQPLLPHQQRPTTHSSLTPTSHTERRHARLRLRHCNEYSSRINNSNARHVAQLVSRPQLLHNYTSFHFSILITVRSISNA